MVAGLKFLSKKGFNPQNLTNQKRVWEREQEIQRDGRRYIERQEQLRRERDDDELALSRGDIPRLRFMYEDVPPTTNTTTEAGTDTGTNVNEEYNSNHVRRHASQLNSGDSSVVVGNGSTLITTTRQPGDDDAAAEFRRMIAAASVAGNDPDNDPDDEVDSDDGNDDEVNQNGNLYSKSFGTVLHGSSADRNNTNDQHNNNTNIQHQQQFTKSALEKAVGRKHSTNVATTLDEQIERFPALKYAPRAKGMSTTDIGVSFKPLGAQIRNVKCLVCGIWGHSKGDRECSKSGWDPFSVASSSLLSRSTDIDTKHEQQQQTRQAVQQHPSLSVDNETTAAVGCQRDERLDSRSDHKDRKRDRRHRKDKSRRKHRKRDTNSYSSDPDDDDTSISNSSNSVDSSFDRHRSHKKKKKTKKSHRPMKSSRRSKDGSAKVHSFSETKSNRNNRETDDKCIEKYGGRSKDNDYSNDTSQFYDEHQRKRLKR
jgi:CBF1 interacting corepressor